MKQQLKKWSPLIVLLALTVAGTTATIIWRNEIWAIITSQAARDHFIAWVQSKGIWGILVFLALQILHVVVAVLPGEPVELMAGALFGPIGGLLICLTGVLLGSCFIYAFMKMLGAKALPLEALKKYHFLQDERKARRALYLLFFLPGTPKDMLTYAGPFFPIRAGEFFFISTLARIPSIVTSTIAGSSLMEGQIWLPIVIFIIMGIAGLACIYFENRILDWLHGHIKHKSNSRF